MGAINYYRSLINRGNPNYLVYKNRVVSDGGIVVDEDVTNSRFQFLDDESILSNLIFSVSKDAGNLITSGDIEKAYNMGDSSFTVSSDGDWDMIQPTISFRPPSDYDFTNTNKWLESDFFIVTADLGNYAVCSWFFRAGTFGANTFKRPLHNGGQSSNEASSVVFSSGVVGVQIALSAGGGLIVNSTTTLTANSTYLVCVDGDNNEFKVYKDGVLDSTTAIGASSFLIRLRRAFTLSAYIDNLFPAQAFDGVLPSAYLFNTNLSSQALAIHNNL